MNKYISGKLVVLVSLLNSTAAIPADRAGNYAIWGSGNKSCFSYNKSRTEGTDQSFRDYVMGYITAYNTLSDDTYSISAQKNLDSIMEWFDDYCELKQIHGFEQAIADFIQTHHDRRYRSPPRSRSR